MSRHETISPELRSVERQIDGAYLENPLIQLPHSQACWCFLAFCEERHFKNFEIDGVDSRQEMAVVIDEIVTSMKTPLAWLRQRCSPGSEVRKEYRDIWYQASWDLAELVKQYTHFEAAYTYASAEVISLHLRGNDIFMEGSLRDDARFEAYDRMCFKHGSAYAPEFGDFLERLGRSVRVTGRTFRYQINPAIVREGLEVLRPHFDRFFQLPPSWSLPRYTFGDFQAVVAVLGLLAIMHTLARRIAASQGCIGAGYCSSVIVMDNEELSSRLRRYTGLDPNRIAAITSDLTYGNRGLRFPDPALQPIIPLTNERIAISPILFIGADAERNFSVLLNRLPAERDAYSRLSADRERLSCEKVVRELKHLPLRFWSGSLPGRSELPDIDLAIIDEEQRSALVLELKSFIGPAEPREILDKSQEIRKGINQAIRLKEAFHSAASSDTLICAQIPRDYSLCFAVASESFVGMASVQHESVPVVRTDHLIHRFRAGRTLPQICEWLQTRAYLPIEGAHYRVEDSIGQIGGWRVHWYGIKPLIGGDFGTL